ncbi:MAG: TOBE domain-containing protein, partial [Geminicoccales bacterium]
AIGRAIVREPRVFLFDEPLSNLDAALRVQMRIELARLHEALRATMIYVTHDQVEAMTMADKIVVLQGGIVEQAGTPLELYHHPRNLFVAGFIGSPKMNFLPATVAAVEAGGVTVALPGGATVTVPVRPGALRQGDETTLGVRPEHLRPAETGELAADILVVERLGGETFLYGQLPDDSTITIQADGEIPTRVHDRVAISLDPATCHLFDAGGLALERAQRHPLADMRRPTARKAS